MFKTRFHVNIHSILSQEEFSGQEVSGGNRGLFELRPISPITVYVLIKVMLKFVLKNNMLRKTLKGVGNYANFY